MTACQQLTIVQKLSARALQSSHLSCCAETNAINNQMNSLWLLALLCICVPASSINVQIDTTKVIHVTSDKFVSAAIDQSLLSAKPQFQTWDFNSPRLLTLLRGFAPTYFRFGGSLSDHAVYSDVLTNVTEEFKTNPPLLTMTSKQWEAMLRLTSKAGIRYLHDFNLQLRFGTQWDPTNALAVIEHIRSKGLGENLDFELGNEPKVYSPSKGALQLSGTQIGKDYVLLKKVMDDYPEFKNSILIGPESVSAVLNPGGAKLVHDFLEVAGSVITAMTFHHYYFYGPNGSVSDFINPKYFSNLEIDIQKAFDIVKNTSYPNTPVWIGETSDCWGGGAKNLSDRYLDGFLWLDKLGVSAKMGIGVVVRQTFYGGNYNLISNELYPNPTYWLCYLYKLLVGARVLMVKETSTSNGLVRVYAHCASNRTGQYKPGAVTLYALSVSKNETSTISFSQDLGQRVDRYFMSPGGPDGLLSQYVALNGQKLKMVDDNTMPPITPVHEPFSSDIIIPPLTFGYWVFPDAHAKACM